MVRLILVSTEFNWSGIVIENHGRAVSGMIRHHKSPHTTVPYAVEYSSICLSVKEEGNAGYLGPDRHRLRIDVYAVYAAFLIYFLIGKRS